MLFDDCISNEKLTSLQSFMNKLTKKKDFIIYTQAKSRNKKNTNRGVHDTNWKKKLFKRNKRPLSVISSPMDCQPTNHPSHRCFFSRKTENSMHELIIVDLDPSITIRIQPSKGLAKLFDDDTGAHKSIKRDSRWRAASNGNLTSFNVYPARGNN